MIWLTPPHVLDALEPFDLDPCAAPGWPTAAEQISEPDDGLAATWSGRAWVNPPYGDEVWSWLDRLAQHARGVALIFARTETEGFHRQVWGRASGLLFLEGRLHFHFPGYDPRAARRPHEHVYTAEPGPDGAGRACAVCGRAKTNAGAPSVLCAYSLDDLDALAASDLPGHLTPLRLPRGVVVAALDASWGRVVAGWLERQEGPVALADLYRAFARHPKAKANRNWRAKIRQTLQRGAGRRVRPGVWSHPDLFAA